MEERPGFSRAEPGRGLFKEAISSTGSHPDSGLPASPSCLSALSFSLFLTLLVVDADHHGEGGAKRNDPADRVRPRSLPVLDLHPAVHVVSCNYHFL